MLNQNRIWLTQNRKIPNSRKSNGMKVVDLYTSNPVKLMQSDQEQLVKLAYTKMPFGKYKDRFLIDLPEAYLVWFKTKGFPKGTLGEQLQLVYELKMNGLEELIRNIKDKFPLK